MKLATKAYIVTLILLTLVFAAPAQKRSDTDDRNIAPTVGTGGPVGGPTGLFTVYDGQTLRKGEFTISAAVSNYDRDPGNADITSVPLSFQMGLTNKLELFFTTEGYRGVKVNSPQNLSSFYLPNATLLVNGVNNQGGAIVLAPGTTGAFAGAAIFRPVGSPYCVYPFVNCNAGTYGFNAPFFSGPAFGFAAGTNALLGPPRAGGGGGADLFPGVGSVYGSILPGVVIRTQNLTLNGVNVGTGPLVFSSAPTYLNDAPFIARPWATSSFNSVDFGVKWRFNSVSDSWGHGIVAYYRWYLDHASDSLGFNSLQRGAGPGDSRGDIGVTYFADARVTRWANVSGNAGYVYTSKTRANVNGTDYTIFDPADELHLAVGVDFPVNKYLQPILEYRYLRYVGGHTPNALQQNPHDAIAGFRVYPRRWFGFGLAWRYNVNQEDDGFFSNASASNNTVLVCGPLSAAGCASTTLTRSNNGVPLGFVTSTDPHGYIAQFWIGRRDKRAGPIVNMPANVDSVALSSNTITLGCPPGQSSDSGCADGSHMISVATKASDPENDVLTYSYTVSGGRIVGTGANVQWDLGGATTGTYTITTGVDDGCGICGRTNTQTITIRSCPDCHAPPVNNCSCGSISVSGPSGITNPGDAMTFIATLSGSNNNSPTYNWSVSAGSIESGQGTPSITVRTNKDMGGGNVTATVQIGGFDPACSCPSTGSDTAGVAALPVSNETSIGAAKPDEIKASMDLFFTQLGNDPAARGYIINYGTPAQIKQRRAIMEAAIKFRHFDSSRITFVSGPADASGVHTRFVFVPAGAATPTP